MPVKYQTSFESAKCPESYYVRLRRPTCSLGEKPFTPQDTRGNRTKLDIQKETDLPPIQPSYPMLTTNTYTIARGNRPELDTNLEERDRVQQSTDSYLEIKDDDDIYTNVFKSHVKQRLSDGISEKGYGKMTASEIDSARMTKVSYINLTEGRLAALAYTKDHLPNYELDTELTNEHGALFKNKETGELRLAYRGTQAARDWDTNMRMLTLQEEGGVQVKGLEEQMAKIEKAYGKKPDLLTGHSKGGGQAIYMGEKHGINTHTQDPFVPTRHWFGGKTNAQHTVIRTPTDVVSSVSNISKFREGFTQVDIQASAGESVLQSHDLNVMTGVEYKMKGNTTYNPKLKDMAYLAQHIQEGH